MRIANYSATLLALGSILAWPGSAQAQSTSTQQGTAANNTTAQTVTAEDLSDHPQKYYGKTVTVKEDVSDVLGSNLFTIEDGEFFGTSPDILVFAPDAEASPREYGTVTVTGRVRQFTQADFEREYGWGWGGYPWGVGYYGYPWYGTAAGPDYFVHYQNRPVIIASSVTTNSGRELVSNSGSNGRETVGALSGNADNAVTDLSAITSGSAQQLAGRNVRLTGITVDRVSGDHGFWTTTSQGQRVFVALDSNIRQPQLRQGEKVTVAGKLNKVPSDQSKIDAKQWGLSNDDVTQLIKSGVFVRAHAVMSGTQK